MLRSLCEILQFEPHKRPTAQALLHRPSVSFLFLSSSVLSHQWYFSRKNTPPPKELNRDVVAKTCEYLGCTPYQVAKSRYDSVRTTYNLLLEKHEKGPSTVLLPKYVPTTGSTLSTSLSDMGNGL